MLFPGSGGRDSPTERGAGQTAQAVHDAPVDNDDGQRLHKRPRHFGQDPLDCRGPSQVLARTNGSERLSTATARRGHHVAGPERRLDRELRAQVREGRRCRVAEARSGGRSAGDPRQVHLKSRLCTRVTIVRKSHHRKH